MAGIYSKPDFISFSLPHSDDSGKRLSVSINEKMKDVRIGAGDSILVAVEDIDWLRDRLSEIKSISEIKEK